MFEVVECCAKSVDDVKGDTKEAKVSVNPIVGAKIWTILEF
jgi:hypothetical protein